MYNLRITKGVKTVAISKGQPVELVQTLYDDGHRNFGENRVNELIEKQKALPNDINWHFVGHLQTNKVKPIVPFIHLIHSIDSLRLLGEVNWQALKIRRVLNCLLQIKIAQEDNKQGLSRNLALELLGSTEYRDMRNIRIIGVMGMATNTEDQGQIRNEFKSLKQSFNVIKERYYPDDSRFKEISAGMSSDYKIAIEEGATIVRIGKLLFS